MTTRICLSADEAFQAGFEEPCEHRVPDPNQCPNCRLTAAEIRRLVVLLRSDPTPERGVSAAA